MNKPILVNEPIERCPDCGNSVLEYVGNYRPGRIGGVEVNLRDWKCLHCGLTLTEIYGAQRDKSEEVRYTSPEVVERFIKAFDAVHNMGSEEFWNMYPEYSEAFWKGGYTGMVKLCLQRLEESEGPNKV